MRVPAALAAPSSCSCGFNCRVHAMSLGGEAVDSQQGLVLLLSKGPSVPDLNLLPGGHPPWPTQGEEPLLWAGAEHAANEIKVNVANDGVPEYWDLGYCVLQC